MAESGINKSERLINLTMALLATKRFLRKNEIFESVEGYQGTPESKERMFERDKTELRSLGLEIEVGNDDPLFEDEPGYRILPSNYSLDLGEIEPEDIYLLSLAGSHWQNSLFSQNSQTALRKIEALYGAIDRTHLDLSFIQQETPEEKFSEIWLATANHREISFEYRSRTLSLRRVQPYALYLSNSRWYFVGFDLDKKDIRQFKIARVATTNFSVGKTFAPPEDFNLQDFLKESLSNSDQISCEVLVRKGKAQEFRAIATPEEFDSDWDHITLKELTESELFELLAKAGNSAKIHSPVGLQRDFISWIEGKRNV